MSTPTKLVLTTVVAAMLLAVLIITQSVLV